MNFDIEYVFTKAVAVIGSATVLGGGAMVLTAHRENAVQTNQIVQLEQSVGRIDALSEKLDLTNTNLAELNGYLRGRSEQRQ